MKNFLRKWWVEHNNEEYCRSIIRGTMNRMRQLAHAKGHPISDYYRVVTWVTECISKIIEKIKNSLLFFCNLCSMGKTPKTRSQFIDFFKFFLLEKKVKFFLLEKKLNFRRGFFRKHVFQKWHFLFFWKLGVLPIVQTVFKK